MACNSDFSSSSLSNLFTLRSDKQRVLNEFVKLVENMYNVLPEEYKTILKNYIKG